MINFDIVALSSSCFVEQKTFFFLRLFFPLIQFWQMIQFNGVECDPCFSSILLQLISFFGDAATAANEQKFFFTFSFFTRWRKSEGKGNPISI